MSGLALTYGQATHIGRVRQENQDACEVFPEEAASGPDAADSASGAGQAVQERLFVVADGMGGHAGGREASATAVAVIGAAAFASTAEPAHRLRQAFAAANARIRASAQARPDLRGMGTTASALLLHGGCASLAHVGDSRIYRLNGAALERLTHDHSEVEELVRRGLLTPEQAERHPRRHVLVRSLGLAGEVRVDVAGPFPLQAETAFVLCTDGLAAVSAEEIERVVRSMPPEEACRRLVQLANERGGRDNVTVQVVRVDAVPKGVRCGGRPRPRVLGLAGALLLALLVVVAWLLL